MDEGRRKKDAKMVWDCSERSSLPVLSLPPQAFWNKREKQILGLKSNHRGSSFPICIMKE